MKSGKQAGIDCRVAGSQAPRDTAIQGLRGIAMSLVFLNHFRSYFGPLLPADSLSRSLLALLPTWSLGSSTFLIIACYFTYRRFAMGDHPRWIPFFGRRLRRIVPLYWTVLGVYGVVGIVAYMRAQTVHLSSAPQVIANVLLIAPLVNAPSIITVSWTLSYILLCYCTIPFIAIFVSRFPARWFRILVLVAVGAISTVGVQVAPGLFNYGLTMTAGMILFEAFGSAGFRKFLDVLGDGGALLLLIGSMVLHAAAYKGALNVSGEVSWAIQQTLLVASISVIVGGRLTHKGPLNRFLMSSGAGWLGKISYSYYLAHGPCIALVCWGAIAVFPAIKGSQIFVWCVLPVAYALSLLGAAVLYGAVEARWVRSGGPKIEKAPTSVQAASVGAVD